MQIASAFLVVAARREPAHPARGARARCPCPGLGRRAPRLCPSLARAWGTTGKCSHEEDFGVFFPEVLVAAPRVRGGVEGK